ncbi:MAG TPA: hypothetical protein VKA48_03680 [Gammaproteobacteria bacterium]|nr:hypothetical protein [Gammaproteobacteria bacterium]
MQQTSWNEREDEALQGLPLEAQLLYLRALRQNMDYDTGVVGGPSRRISWRSLREVLYVEPHQGINGGMPDRAKARRVIQWVEKAGLAERLDDQEHLLFRLPLATLGSSAQKKADPKPTPSRPPEPEREADPEPDPAKTAQQSESAGKADPEPEQEADPKPTPGRSKKADPHPGSGTPVKTATDINPESPGGASVTPHPAAATQRPDQAREVFDYWVQRMQKGPQTKFTRDRKQKVEARLRERYSVEDLKQAIDGCASSAFHQGENDEGKTYNDLELICRKGSKVEQFMERATQAPRPQGKAERRLARNRQSSAEAVARIKERGNATRG